MLRILLKTRREEEISNLESKIEELNTKLESCGADFEKAREYYDEISACNEALSIAYDEWNAFSEELEKMQ
jgi:chaperonin cofactor prefoldin